MRLPLTLLIILNVLALTAAGDEVLLKDGSRLVGVVTCMADGNLTLETDFAGELTIRADRIAGVFTERSLTIETNDHERLVGQLYHDERRGQWITGEGLLDQPIALSDVATILPEVEPDLPPPPPPEDDANWSTRLQAGLNGQTGSRDRLEANGRVEVRRNTDQDRLLLFLQGRYARDRGVQSAREFIGGTTYERDVNTHRFVFFKSQFENDKFENLDLRATFSTGLGQFLIRQSDQELKVRLGLGVEYEDYSSGGSDCQAIGEAGVDYFRAIAPWLLFNHTTSYYPAVTDFGNYRVVVENAMEIPISNDRKWKLRVGIRNQFNAMPEANVDELDTYYYGNLVWDFD